MCNSFEQKILATDLYNKSFTFLMPDGRDRYRTYLGALLSVLTFIIVIAYAGYKFTDLLGYNDYSVMKFELENFYDMRDAFGSENGFLLAAGVTDYSSNEESIEDPEIGTIKLIKKTWDSTDLDGEGALLFEEIPTRPCTSEDFFEESDTSFYPTKKTSVAEI